jgi:xylose dehydrogenase (NAD/NADP)
VTAAVKWGLLSTAAIGATVVRANRGSLVTNFMAVASRDAAKARVFASEHGVPASFGSYSELLASDHIDAVYVALPIALHVEWTIKALEAGKHVLCEKPLAMSGTDAARVFDAAERAGRQCVEGLMYRHHPQTLAVTRLLEQGAIGDLTAIRSALSVSVGRQDIRRTGALGGGALLDLGCYCVSATRLFGGEPVRVFAEAVQDAPEDPSGASDPDGVDLRMAATLRLPNEVVAQFDVGLDLERRDQLELVGTGGRIVVGDPWLCRWAGVDLVQEGRMTNVPVEPQGGTAFSGPDSVYRGELDAVSTAILDGRPLPFGREDAIAQATVLAALRASAEAGHPIDL